MFIFLYDVTGILMDAPGNKTPSMMRRGSLRGSFTEEAMTGGTDSPDSYHSDTKL
jgi:hypothetical protein